MSSTATSPAPVKRACDSCHRRKVKCTPSSNAAQCQNCTNAGLACTYNAIPQKKGPKGSRAKVLSELRESQSRNPPFTNAWTRDLAQQNERLGDVAFARNPNLACPPMIEHCIEHYYEFVYQSEPFLHRQRAQEARIAMDRYTEPYCMLTALCAYEMIITDWKPHANYLPRPEMASLSSTDLGSVLLEESVRVRGSHNYRENPTYLTVLTSYLYSCCYLNLGKENTAWGYLRDATSQAQILGMHQEENYKQDPLDVDRKRILFWLLFIAERNYALHKHRPISLYPTIHPPALNEVHSDRPIADGLGMLVNMYKLLDDTFTNLWNRVLPHTSQGWIPQMQTQLAEAVPSAYFECPESQAVMIRVTQQWLKAQTWALACCLGMVSVANDGALNMKFPIEVAKDLLRSVSQFALEAIEVHGVEFIEKLYDIACCLVDVVALTSFAPDPVGFSPSDLISQFLTLISKLRGGQSRYYSLLHTKISERLPSFSLPPVVPTSMGYTGNNSTIPSNHTTDFTGLPAVSSPAYPSNDAYFRLPTQAAAPLPYRNPASMMSGPPNHVDELPMYGSSHGTTHSSGSDGRSNTGTPGPGPYEPPMSTAAQMVTHNPMQLSSSHATQSHIQSHHLGVNPTAYDPRFNIQGYPVDPNMMFKQ